MFLRAVPASASSSLHVDMCRCSGVCGLLDSRLFQLKHVCSRLRAYWLCCCRRLVQLLTSLGATVVLSKSTALAAPALLFPIWSPWIRAGGSHLVISFSNPAFALGMGSIYGSGCDSCTFTRTE
jgi:hypothetical protein